MRDLDRYIRHILSQGKVSFTSSEARDYLHLSATAFWSAIKIRLERKEAISPAKGLYVIIPPEYEVLGCLPANELLPILFKHWGIPYYVCLLSASMYYGSSNQKPQVFQVMSSKRLKKLQLGKIEVEFIFKKNIENVIFRSFDTVYGSLRVSSPEYTVFDLLQHPNKSGGLNNIASILSELIENIDVDEMLKVIKENKGKAWVQRLGYILDNIHSDNEVKKMNLIKKLKSHLNKLPMGYVPLLSDISTKGSPRNKYWKICVNTEIEAD